MLLLFILPLVVEAAVLLKEVMILGLVIMTSQNNRWGESGSNPGGLMMMSYGFWWMRSPKFQLRQLGKL